MASDDKERGERLAAALRENLKRRKAQAREFGTGPKSSAAPQDGSGGPSKRAS
jgi:hypothetical protein